LTPARARPVENCTEYYVLTEQCLLPGRNDLLEAKAEYDESDVRRSWAGVMPTLL
jgi:hypothetical protein